jgi:hypothetical protein
VIEFAPTGDTGWIAVDQRSDFAEVNQMSALNIVNIRKYADDRFIRLHQMKKIIIMTIAPKFHGRSGREGTEDFFFPFPVLVAHGVYSRG